jgi:hypothetical protein
MEADGPSFRSFVRGSAHNLPLHTARGACRTALVAIDTAFLENVKRYASLLPRLVAERDKAATGEFAKILRFFHGRSIHMSAPRHAVKLRSVRVLGLSIKT